jgi:hypothetical protein
MPCRHEWMVPGDVRALGDLRDADEIVVAAD